jgi:hypothetical protein
VTGLFAQELPDSERRKEIKEQDSRLALALLLPDDSRGLLFSGKRVKSLV